MMLLKASLKRSRPTAASLIMADADAAPMHPARGVVGHCANAGARMPSSVMPTMSMTKREGLRAPRCSADLIRIATTEMG
jgi:hypothetical protein